MFKLLFENGFIQASLSTKQQDNVLLEYLTSQGIYIKKKISQVNEKENEIIKEFLEK